MPQLQQRSVQRTQASLGQACRVYSKAHLACQSILLLYPHSADETVAIMLNTPLEWNVMLRWSKSLPIESILMLAKQYKDTLISTWKFSCHFRTQEPTQSKHAHHASVDNDPQVETGSIHSPFEDNPEDVFHYSSNEWNIVSKDTFSIQRSRNHRPSTQDHYSPKTHNADSVEKTYPYPKDDSVMSHHKLGQKCFPCGSENHWVRECSHYRAYSSRLDQKTLQKEHQHYESP
jgi:Zinc knuckle